MKTFWICIIYLISFIAIAQSPHYLEEIRLERMTTQKEFLDANQTPLTPEDLATFDSLPYFKIDITFCVMAYLEKTPNTKKFKMKTSTKRLPEYTQFGLLHFVLQGDTFQLPIYKSMRLSANPVHKDYLFLPFTDLTNGDETYGGGRFLDMKIPNEDSLTLDFNKAYNPLCAYNYKYSCPIPPKENHLDIRIEAGVKTSKKH